MLKKDSIFKLVSFLSHLLPFVGSRHILSAAVICYKCKRALCILNKCRIIVTILYVLNMNECHIRV